jgi:tetratricopeptide (TPR) repeat protein
MAVRTGARPIAPRWYHEPWSIFVLILAFPPLGFYLLIWRPGPRYRQLAAALGIALFVTFLGGIELVTGAGASAYSQYSAFVDQGRGRYLQNRGAHREAMTILEQSLAEDTDDPDINCALARSAHRLKQDHLAASLLTSAIRHAGGERGILDLVNLYMDTPATFARGEELLKRSIENGQIRATDPRALIARAKSELHAEQPVSAAYHLRQVVDQFERSYYPDVYRLFAEVARREGNKRQEVAYLCDVLRVDPEDPAIWERLEAVLRSLGLSPVPYWAYMRAIQLHTGMDAHDEGRKLLERILEKAPTVLCADECHYALATHYFYYVEDFRLARVHYSTVVRSYPRGEVYQRSLYQLGATFEKLGDDDGAATVYRRLIDEAPQGTLARMSRIRIVRMERLGRIGGSVLDVLTAP